MIGEGMLWVAAVLTLVTGWDYLLAGFRHASAPKASAPRGSDAVPRRPG
jgi:cardiolipin synthase (CMP-forming)